MAGWMIGFVGDEWMDLIYMAVIAGWAVVVFHRHINLRIRYLLVSICICLLSFLLLKICRYTLLRDMPDRYLRMIWYLYYIPMLTVPLSTFYASVIMKNEYGFGREKLHYYLWAVLGVLVAGFLTNDHHQLAFAFPDGKPDSFGSYEHGVLYYLAFLWIGMLFLLAFVNILQTCSMSPRRKYLWIPFLPPVLLGIYSVIYINYGEFLHIGTFRIRLAEVYCFTVIITWESIMQVGFLPYKSSFGDRKSHRASALSFKLSPWTQKITELFRESDEGELPFTDALADAAVYGAYVKRSGNLLLLADVNDRLSIAELYLSVSESMEYLRLKGIEGVLWWEDGKRNLLLPAEMVVFAYHLFEKKIEEAYPYIEAVAVSIGGQGVPHMRLELLGPDTVYDIALDRQPGMARKVYEHFFSAGGRRFPEIGSGMLDTKMRLHEEMGNALILAKRYLTSEDDVTRVQLLEVWKKCFLLLQDEKEETQYDPYKAVLTAARDVGVKVHFDGDIVGNVEKKRLVAAAIGECVTNTFRHAKGDALFVKIREGKDGWLVTITNNGKPPSGEIIESGGLKSLRAKIEGAGLTMQVNSEPVFEMILQL